MYAAESGPIPAEDKLNNAESAVRLFAACYAKDLVADDFPRNNGFFSDDLKTALCRLNKIVSDATIIHDDHKTTIKTPTRKHHRPMLKGLTYKNVASLYNQCAQPLIRHRLPNGEVEFEPQRGGHRTGYVVVGSCSVSTIKNWIKEYPNASKVHKHNGFHAGLLEDEDGLKKSVQQWNRYVEDYVRQFEEWRKTHPLAKRSDFRYKKLTMTHRNY